MRDLQAEDRLTCIKCPCIDCNHPWYDWDSPARLQDGCVVGVAAVATEMALFNFSTEKTSTKRRGL